MGLFSALSGQAGHDSRANKAAREAGAVRQAKAAREAGRGRRAIQAPQPAKTRRGW